MYCRWKLISHNWPRFNSFVKKDYSEICFACPKLSCSLLSVSCLPKDSNCHIIFGASGCEFQDLNIGMMIGNARMIEDFYYFDENHAKNKQAQGFIGNVVHTLFLSK